MADERNPFREAAENAAMMAAPYRDTLGAKAVAYIRSLLPGHGSYHEELAAYNAEATPNPLRRESVVEPPERWADRAGGAAAGYAAPIKVVGEGGLRVFHGGPEPITKVDSAKLQTARPAAAGPGFYTSHDARMGNRYARIHAQDDGAGFISSFDLPEGARVLETNGVSWKVDPVDLAAVEAHAGPDLAASDYADLRHAINSYARAQGLDAVRFNDMGETVVLNPDALRPVKQTRIPIPKRVLPLKSMR